MPGGRSANDSRPVNRGSGDEGQRPINAYEFCRRVPDSSGLNDVTASALYSRCNSYPTVSPFAPTPLQLDEAGGAVTGAPGVGGNRDVWM